MQVYQDIIECLQTKPDSFCRVITGDEICIFEYDPQNKGQSSQCKSLKSPRLTKAWQSKSKLKSCWSCSSMWEVLSTASSSHRRQQSVNKSTSRSCGICFAQSTRRNECCDRTNRDCFITTIHLLATPRAFDSSWPRGTLLIYQNLSRMWPSRPGLQNTPTASLQRGKTLLTSVLDMTLNNLMVRFQ